MLHSIKICHLERTWSPSTGGGYQTTPQRNRPKISAAYISTAIIGKPPSRKAVWWGKCQAHAITPTSLSNIWRGDHIAQRSCLVILFTVDFTSVLGGKVGYQGWQAFTEMCKRKQSTSGPWTWLRGDRHNEVFNPETTTGAIRYACTDL